LRAGKVNNVLYFLERVRFVVRLGQAERANASAAVKCRSQWTGVASFGAPADEQE
jgi:hypothetical protein